MKWRGDGRHLRALQCRGLTVYESVIEELREANEIEERAYDRFLQARDEFAVALVPRAMMPRVVRQAGDAVPVAGELVGSR